MPIKTPGYRCQFRCGDAVSPDIDVVVEHERDCLCNPANRCCLSCKHDSREPPMYGNNLCKENQGMVLSTCLKGHITDLRAYKTGCKHYRQKRVKP